CWVRAGQVWWVVDGSGWKCLDPGLGVTVDTGAWTGYKELVHPAVEHRSSGHSTAGVENMSLRMDRRPAFDCADDELVARFHDGDSCALDVLLQRYRRFARAKARTYFLVGADADDIEQEGLIGLYKAARDFRPDRQSSFRAFAELCITRQVITAIK